jgi:hypothetical protein
MIGQYLWLALQNSRGRPNFVVRSAWQFGPGLPARPVLPRDGIAAQPDSRHEPS